MGETLAPQHRPRGIAIVSLLLTLQAVFSLCLAAILLYLGVSGVRNAAAAHKATAATLTTAMMVVGDGVLLTVAIAALLIAWSIWRKGIRTFTAIAILETFALLASLAMLGGGNVWLFVAYGALAVVTVVYLCADRQLQTA